MRIRGETQPHYTLMDTDTANVIGVFRSRIAALRQVADAAQRYGRDSAAVRSLALVRDDVPLVEGFIARGLGLADLALERCGQREDALTQHHGSRHAAGGQ